MEDISSLKRDGGGFKGIPDVTMNLSILDSTSRNIVKTLVLERRLADLGRFPLVEVRQPAAANR